MNHFCVECGEKLTGRADKKFCDDQCRTHYHNRSAFLENQQVRKVNNVLRKNRRILSEFLGEKEITRIPKERLLLKGFDFTFHTQQWSGPKKSRWLFIYDLGCKLEREEEILISRVEKIQKKKFCSADFS